MPLSQAMLILYLFQQCNKHVILPIQFRTLTSYGVQQNQKQPIQTITLWEYRIYAQAQREPPPEQRAVVDCPTTKPVRQQKSLNARIGSQNMTGNQQPFFSLLSWRQLLLLLAIAIKPRTLLPSCTVPCIDVVLYSPACCVVLYLPACCVVHTYLLAARSVRQSGQWGTYPFYYTQRTAQLAQLPISVPTIPYNMPHIILSISDAGAGWCSVVYVCLYISIQTTIFYYSIVNLSSAAAYHHSVVVGVSSCTEAHHKKWLERHWHHMPTKQQQQHTTTTMRCVVFVATSLPLPSTGS